MTTHEAVPPGAGAPEALTPELSEHALALGDTEAHVRLGPGPERMFLRRRGPDVRLSGMAAKGSLAYHREGSFLASSS